MIEYCRHCQQVIPGKHTVKHPTRKNIYSVWINMKRRCYNEKDHAYADYGGRGIKIHDGWLENFESFENWANQNGYRKGLTLDRINNDGNYEPSNCQWVTQAVQNLNKRNILTLYFKDGTAVTTTEITRKYKIKRDTLLQRINRGMTLEDAIAIPVREYGVSFRGEIKLLKEWLRIYDIPRELYYYRLKKGMSFEEALTTPIKPRGWNLKAC